MDNLIEKAREELDKEFRQVRDNLDKIQRKLDKVRKAGPEDDIYGMLGELEDTVEEVRTGGVVGSGAKGHREAREKYFEMRGKSQ